MRQRRANQFLIEACPYRHGVNRHEDSESASCGLIEQILGKRNDGSCSVERAVCESCRQSFPPSPRHPNPVVASVLYRRASRLAGSASTSLEAQQFLSLAEHARQNLDVMYARPLALEPEPDQVDRRALAEIVPPPAARHGRRVREWAIGVTTAPRIQPVLSTCLESLGRAGWGRPRLFVDSAVIVPAPHDQLPCTVRDERVGAWANYYLTLAELLLGQPRADAFMVVQDDALFYHRQSISAYLETVLWPGKVPCLVSLYCSRADSASSPGWHAAHGVMRSGPVALAFPPELAKAFLTDREVFEHRWRRDELEATSIGDVISEWAYKRGVPVWLPTPSLVQHVGDTSTIWRQARAKGKRQAGWFAGTANPSEG
jgi:hypothetical protein